MDISAVEEDTMISDLGETITSTATNSTTLMDAEMSTTQIVNCFAGVLMTLLTLSGQIMVFVVVSREPRLRTPSNYFIISLAVADLLISIISMPVWTVYSTLGYWPLSQLWCDVWNVFDYVLCCISIYTIVFMSIDRYLTLQYPLTYRVKRTSAKAKRALILIWIITALALTAFIGSSQYVLGKNRDPLECATYYLTSPALIFIMVITVHWSGVGGTALFYCLIYRIATKSGKISINKIKIPLNGSEDDTKSDDVSQDTEESNISQQSRDSKAKVNRTMKVVHNVDRERRKFVDRERKALRTILFLLIVFAICWLPLSFVFVVEALRPGYLSIWWIIVGYWLGYVNSMLNPVCYAAGNPYFRETLFKVLCMKKR